MKQIKEYLKLTYDDFTPVEKGIGELVNKLNEGWEVFCQNLSPTTITNPKGSGMVIVGRHDIVLFRYEDEEE